MREPASSSLMDDREFLAELEQLEPVADADEYAHERECTLEELEEGLSLAQPAYPRELIAEPEIAPAQTPEPAPASAPTPEQSEIELTQDQLVWLLTGFLVGGAGAALIFHQRVADIISLLR